MKLVANGPGIGDSMFLSAVAWEVLQQCPGEYLTLSVAHPELYAGWRSPFLRVEPWDGPGARTFPELDDQNVTRGNHNVVWMLGRLGLTPPPAESVRQWCPPIRSREAAHVLPMIDMLRSVFAQPLRRLEDGTIPPELPRSPGPVPFITISPKAGGWTRNKDWPLPWWQSVVSGLRAFIGCAVVQLGAAEDELVPGAVDFRGRPLVQVVELLRAAAVHVSVVTGTMHIASGTGTATVALFGGREHPNVTGYPDAVNLYAEPERGCSPCWLVEPCPYSVTVHNVVPECMAMLPPGVVLGVVGKRYDERKKEIEQCPTA